MRQPCLSREMLLSLLEENPAALECSAAVQHLSDCPRCQAMADRIIAEFGLALISPDKLATPPAAAEPEQLGDLVRQIKNLPRNESAADSADRTTLDRHLGSRAVTDGAQQFVESRAEPDAKSNPDTRSLTGQGLEHGNSTLPERIGRYRVVSPLGQGGFGWVFLAYDDQLSRAVAIKVPRSERLSRPEDAEAYLTEARTAANLDHPNIVPIFDVGTLPDGLCYVVSKVIEGSDLAKMIQHSRPSHTEAAGLIASVAEALHYAHRKGVVHRDIKPANILLDTNGQSYVADFGLALKDEDFGKGSKFAGTPSYMSPEQARGEGHRVDGRSDIFSLGVVFYELLVGKRPFQADTRAELLEQITTVEVRPPRQIDDQIPKELERICFKALAKRESERYTTAKDMADDLRHFLVESPASGKSTITREQPSQTAIATPVLTPTAQPSSDSRPIRIIPKGLRSFDAHDADFFLELLPGPRDRDGLPDSIRFWKTRIEETDADNTFSVGLIYGPSGCGKSSLMKAGLLPRLSQNLIVIYVEATAEETETRLLNGLRKRCPSLPDDLRLKETLAALRRGQGIRVGKKVVIILDQFEQWFHAKKEEENTELVQALRQCDGGRVQCIIMVRDDFWVAVSRFMRELEVRLVDGHNSALVDLFPIRHAEKVLASFGRAFGVIPELASDVSKDQKQFLEHAVSDLAQAGKVICVRLALFAEMMKGKTWTPATLKSMGGTEGVGVTFLEETLSAATAPPEHRYHQQAARSVLQSLLPESGTDIKGHMRSYGELLEASGYQSRPKDFDGLIRILDSEIRLITPTDPEGKSNPEESVSKVQSGQKYYQLTHDYLVPSLRDWLTRKLKETRHGRMELLLTDRAAVWNARPENRQLPSLLQWLQIRWWTRKKNWTPPQQKMMSKANRVHAARGIVVGVLLAAATFTGLMIRDQIAEKQKSTHAADLVQAVLTAQMAQLPGLVSEIGDYRKWTDPLLREEYDKSAVKSPRKLHASLALLPVDPGQVAYLRDRLLDAEPHEVPVIRDALLPHKDELRGHLWAVVETPEKGKEWQRLRATAALAKYDPESPRWNKACALVIGDLAQENTVFWGQWSEAFRPVKNLLLPQLFQFYRDRNPERAAERYLATNLLAEYVADQLQVLADLLMDAEDKQFALIYQKFKDCGERGMQVLTDEIDKKLSAELPLSDEHRETLARRQANAAVALFKLNQPEIVWPMLQHGPDPRVRSYLIHRMGSFGADPGAIIKRLDDESDITIRRALILSLGEFGEKELPHEERKTLLPKLLTIYQSADDPGLHGATDWLLRQWKQDEWLKEVNEKWANDQEARDRRFADIQRSIIQDKEQAIRQWYVNSQGQTMVVIPGPVTFTMGSPGSSEEPQHQRRIGRTFAIAAKAVTLEQFRHFENDYAVPENYARLPNLPAVAMDWYQAAKYCNWLSERDGLSADERCYEITGYEVKLKANYLSRNGYRLPTEAEMEYATRAGALTSRYFGETDELLPRYAWYSKNSQNKTWPVGSLKPNDLGLFDMQGNVWTWCQESFKDYLLSGEAAEDQEDDLEIVSTANRVLRGGSFGLQSSSVYSANRSTSTLPTTRYHLIGFRMARTLSAVPPASLPPTQ